MCARVRRESTCVYCKHDCKTPVRAHVDLITLMKRGDCEGKYIHQACAYESYNPAVSWLGRNVQ